MYPHNPGEKFSRCSNCKLVSTCNQTTCAEPHIGEVAAKIGHRLVELECRGRGDLEGAFRRLESRTGIGHRHWRDWWYWQSVVQPRAVLFTTWVNLVTEYKIAATRQLQTAEQEFQEAHKL